ncbi:uncharacterized protein PGTG_22195 [Puccinia graminis f. sp. tritici CRL 75-36-700-3]|uniref:Uncharacterized protein n=1 Tax=Puccinia graminis f. sp. tritici (strain CRL 75-36-700-3 / race SCCL) TaxID=418459 RepID=H6QTY4_PUCGT|nr:uncharacterized protein PGTG_22195 [Puccinia graminis f. sp. tritici CRL 75-36-700-3]EHS64398.1 hypothetical protein PGTG_22195 [Puccinia graminis f. sp. tritici CRL 75-36-700-3]
MSISESQSNDLRVLAQAFIDAGFSMANDSQNRGFASTEEVLSTDELNAHKAVLLQIETSLLPQVRQQLADLLKSFDIDAADPDPRGCLEILPTLETNIIRLNTAIQFLAPLDPHRWYHASHIDCSYGVLKKFRIAYLGRKYKYFVSYPLFSLLRAYEKCLLAEWFPWSHHKDIIVGKTEKCLHIIDGMMRLSKRSDHDIIQERWQAYLKFFDSLLTKQTERINQTDRPIQPQLLSLFQANIPIIKLIRIFYRRITTTPASKQSITFGAQMSSWQILSLQSEVSRIYKSLLRVSYAMDELDEHGQTEYSVGKLRRWINAPAEHLYSSAAFIASYYEPSTSGLACHPPENLFKSLFLDLLTQFRVASTEILTLASKLAPSVYATEYFNFQNP